MALKQELLYWKNVAMEYAIQNPKLSKQQQKILNNIPSRNDSENTKKRWINQVKTNFSSKAVKIKEDKKKLKTQFNYQKKKLLVEQKRREARNRLIGLPKESSDINQNLTQNLNFNDIYNKGIRIYSYRTKKYKHIKGQKAVEYKIKSLIKQNSPEWKKQNFIKEYMKQFWSKYGGRNLYHKMKEALEKLSPAQITYLLNTGALPDVKFYYTATPEDRAVVEDQIDYINEKSWLKDYEATEKNVDAEVNLLAQEEKLKADKFKESKNLKRNRR